MGRFRSSIVPLAAVAALAAGCGTTVAGAGSHTAGGGLNAPGAGTSLPGESPSGVPVPTTAASGPGGLSTSGSGLGLPSGPGAATGSAPQAATGGAGGSTGPAAQDGPGVTATAVYVGDAYSSDSAAADAALGAASASPGDERAQTTAVIDWINAHGGVAHRKLVPIWYVQSVNNDTSTTSQQECAAWTQDHKVLIADGSATATPILDQCTAAAHEVEVNSAAITMETTAMNAAFPADVDLEGLTNDRAMRYTVEGLARQRYFATGAKVGVVTWDDGYYRYGVSHSALPALAALGFRNVPVEYVSPPQAYGDLGGTSASVSSAVLKFRAAGIDHVLLFDGASGINSGGILVLEWMQQAQAQHYNPRYGLNSTSGFNGLAGDLPPQQMAGSVGISWELPLDESSSDFSPSQLPPAGRLCLQIMRNAGQTASGNNALALQLAICDEYFFIAQVLDSIGGALNQGTVMSAIDALGTRYSSDVSFGTDFSATRHDGVYLVRDMAFEGSCGCYRYTSAPYNPGG